MKPYTDEHLAQLCQQLAYLYHSGTPLDKALKLLDSSQVHHPEMWIESFKKHGKMSAVFEDDGCFPAYFIEAFRVAEKVGQEEKLCLSYVKHFNRQSELKQFLKESLSLPMLLLFIFSVLLGLMAWSILPLFERLMAQLGIAHSLFLGLFLWALKGLSTLLVVMWICGALWVFYGEFNHRHHPLIYEAWDKRLLSRLKEATLKRELAEFTSLAYLAIAGGIENKAALKMVQLNHPSKSFLESYNTAIRKLLPHEGMYELVLMDGFYDPLSISSLKTAAQSGLLENALDDLANRLAMEANAKLNQQLGRIEPWLITGLTALVFAMVFAMIIPLLDVLASLG